METIKINQPEFNLPKIIVEINQKHQPILIQEASTPIEECIDIQDIDW